MNGSNGSNGLQNSESRHAGRSHEQKMSCHTVISGLRWMFLGPYEHLPELESAVQRCTLRQTADSSRSGTPDDKDRLSRVANGRL